MGVSGLVLSHAARPVVLAQACVAAAFGLLFYRLYLSPLRRIPGPFLAALTDVWRLLMVLRGRPQEEQLELHCKYGPVVRLGPNVISFADPQAIIDIYSGKHRFRKSDFYLVQRGLRAGRSFGTIFSTTNEDAHAKLRRGAANAYALSTLVTFEPFVDSTTAILLDQITKRWADRTGPAAICDLALWLQYYAFDVIGEVTFSKRLGFLESGKDVGEIIQAIDRGLDYAGPVGQIPWSDYLLRRNPVKLAMGRLGLYNTTFTHVRFGMQRIQERKQELGDKIHERPADRTRPRDFLSRFLEAHYVSKSISEDQVMSLTQANINAGSDTTAISLRTIIHQLLASPDTHAKLVAEIETGEASGLFTDNTSRLVSWAEAQKLPYLDAVIKESLRIHPAVGLSMERIVPVGGAVIAGVAVPGGTVVGCSPWVINFNQDVFGPDSKSFRPERWTEASTEQLSQMKKYFFTFGMGSHTCIGKNISYLEMYKVVAALFRNFELELVDGGDRWKVHGGWFVKQSGLDIRFKTRKFQSPPSIT